MALANNYWFHKHCAVHILHPTFRASAEILERAGKLTSDTTFLGIMQQFFTGTGHALMECAPGAGKTTVAAMSAAAVGVQQVVNIMFNKHNMLDALAKGIPFSYTYHSLACTAILRYLRTHVTYAQLGDDERFSMVDDALYLNALMWTLWPPPDPQHRQSDLRAGVSVNEIGSAKWVFFRDVLIQTFHLGLHNCLGLPVSNIPAQNPIHTRGRPYQSVTPSLASCSLDRSTFRP